MPERTPPDDTTPDQLSTFDQTHAALGENVDTLIKLYREARAENRSAREVDIAGMSEWLQTLDFDRAAFAEMLTVAVVRLAEQERS
jgi:hypothetical protein